MQPLSEPLPQFPFWLDPPGCFLALLLSNCLSLVQVENAVISLGASGFRTELPILLPLFSPASHHGSPACFHGPAQCVLPSQVLGWFCPESSFTQSKQFLSLHFPAAERPQTTSQGPSAFYLYLQHPLMTTILYINPLPLVLVSEGPDV